MATEKNNPEYVLSEDFQIHFFELEKMDVEGSKTFKNRLEKWAFFFKQEGFLDEEEEMQVLLKNDKVMEKAHESYKKFTANDKMLKMYEAREKRIRDEVSNIDYAREQGIDKGIEVTAVRMLKENVEISFISKVTNISEEKLLELKNKIWKLTER